MPATPAKVGLKREEHAIMSRDAINVLLGGGVRVRDQRMFKGNIKGTTKPLMAILDSTWSMGSRTSFKRT